MKRFPVIIAVAAGMLLGGGVTLGGALPVGASGSGSAPVTVTNTSADPVPVSAQGITNVGGTVAVSNFPSSSAVSGTVTANQGSGTGTGGAWKVDGSGVTQPVSGMVNVGNFPSTMPVTGTVSIAPGQPYSNECSGLLSDGDVGGNCSVSAVSSSILVKDVSIAVDIQTGSNLYYCVVLANNSTGTSRAFVPMTKEGSDGHNDSYVGNSQVHILVPSGFTLTAGCSESAFFGIDATFQGEVASS